MEKKTDLDLLLDLDFNSVSSSGVCSKYIRSSAQYVADEFFTVLPSVSAGGLTIEAKFARSPSLFSNSMVSIELLVHFKSNSLEEADISIIDLKVRVDSAVRGLTSANRTLFRTMRPSRQAATLIFTH